MRKVPIQMKHFLAVQLHDKESVTLIHREACGKQSMSRARRRAVKKAIQALDELIMEGYDPDEGEKPYYTLVEIDEPAEERITVGVRGHRGQVDKNVPYIVITRETVQ